MSTGWALVKERATHLAPLGANGLARLVAGGAALVTALVLVVTGTAASPARPLAIEAGVAGIGLLVLALWRYGSALAAAMVAIALPWGTALAEQPRPSEALAVGAGLLLLGELAGASLDLATVVRLGRSHLQRLAVRTLGLLAGGVAVSALLVAVSALPAPGSLLRLAAGLAASLGVVAFVALRRWDR